MDFLYLNKADHLTVNFDPHRQIVSKDRFMDRGQKYVSTDKETLIYRQSLFADIMKNNKLADFLVLLYDKLAEFAPLMNQLPQEVSNEERIHNVLYPMAYVELVSFICNSLSPILDNITSISLKHFFALAKSDMESNITPGKQCDNRCQSGCAVSPN